MAKAVIYGEVGVTIPAGWSDRSIYTFVGETRSLAADDSPLTTETPESTFRPNLVVTRETVPSNGDAETYARDQWNMSLQTLPDLKKETERLTTVDKLAAVDRVFTFTAQGVTVKQRQVFAVSNGFAYALTFTSLPGPFADDALVFDEILRNVSWTGRS